MLSYDQIKDKPSVLSGMLVTRNPYPAKPSSQPIFLEKMWLNRLIDDV